MTPGLPDRCKHYLLQYRMGLAQLLVRWTCLWGVSGQWDHVCSPISPEGRWHNVTLKTRNLLDVVCMRSRNSQNRGTLPLLKASEILCPSIRSKMRRVGILGIRVTSEGPTNHTKTSLRLCLRVRLRVVFTALLFEGGASPDHTRGS